MFGRLMSKVFGIEKKTDESSSKERRHSFEDTSPRKHHTRSKGKRRSTPEAKRQRSEEPPLAFSNVKIEEGASKGDNSVDRSPDSEKSSWINVEIKPPSVNLQECSTITGIDDTVCCSVLDETLSTARCTSHGAEAFHRDYCELFYAFHPSVLCLFGQYL
ncbi:uncharacterized protein LOC134688008 [Mytilus trossulus]|uniref:uncharacterized protein LOC134688008 n=1 Tax=Mytilus trossulus TaxID=6551 RepID=UPI00300440E7